MIDTGATVIALKERDAARVGIHPAPKISLPTSHQRPSRPPRPARQHRDRRRAGARRRRPDHADGMLDQNLLGMASVAAERFEYADGKLVMEQ